MASWPKGPLAARDDDPVTTRPAAIRQLCHPGHRHSRELMVNLFLIDLDLGGEMNKLFAAGAALLAFGLSVPAKAADMPVKYVAPAPVFT